MHAIELNAFDVLPNLLCYFAKHQYSKNIELMIRLITQNVNEVNECSMRVRQSYLKGLYLSNKLLCK